MEKCRQDLAYTTGFEVHSAFVRIERSCTDSLTVSDLQDLLLDNATVATGLEVAAVIQNYDSDAHGCLYLRDFLRLVLPATNLYLREVVLGRPAYSIGYFERLPGATESALARLFESEIRFSRLVGGAEAALRSRFDYSPVACFSVLDRLLLGRIGREDLRAFSRVHGFPLLDRDIDAIIRRIDRDADEHLAEGEFFEFLSLKNPSARSAPSSPVSALRRRDPISFPCTARRGRSVARQPSYTVLYAKILDERSPDGPIKNSANLNSPSTLAGSELKTPAKSALASSTKRSKKSVSYWDDYSSVEISDR